MHISQLFISFLKGVELRYFSVQNARGGLVCVIDNSKFSFLLIQTLHNDCLHIEDVHLLFCAHFTTFFSFLRGVELRYFFVQNAKSGPGLCNL